VADLVIPEKLDGSYHGSNPPSLMKPGEISGGKNVRKVSPQVGGWKPRKGCALHNTTALESGSAVKSLHYFESPFGSDEHFIAQVNSKLVTQTAQNKLPPAVDATFGTSLGVTVGTTPGFGAKVGEYFFYADGSGRPIAYGGTTPRVKGFFCYDISNLAWSDYSRNVTDGRSDTSAVMTGAATDYAIVLTEERASALQFVLGSLVNNNAETLIVSAWRSGAWAAVSGLTDTTENPAGTTMAVNGSASWTASALDELYSYRGIQGYAYKLSWSGAIDSVNIVSITCAQAATAMTNKWNGEMSWVAGAKFYDDSLGQYVDVLGSITNESVSQYMDISEMQTGDFIYLKTPDPACIFGLGVVDGYGNTTAAAIDQIENWVGDGWNAITTNLQDLTLDSSATKSFAQTGTFAFDAGILVGTKKCQRSILAGDSLPGYWYRISVAAALSTDVRVYAIVYGAYPEALPTYNGCVEFKNRLFVWGDPEFPNRLRYSAREAPFCFNGADSGYTDAFGAMDKILCAIKFYNELIVWKERSVWLLEGDSPATFGTLKITDKVGIASPKSAQVAEIGFPTLHRDEPLLIAIWQDIDGVYTFDGRKTKKESDAISQYFNPESSDCVAAASLTSLQAGIDRNNNEYHLLLPSVELVFNYESAEWFPPWSRAIALTTMVDFRANDNRHYSYGGSASGFIMRLETDTTDKSVANADVAIDHSIKSRAISYEQTGRLVRFTLRQLLAELVARSAGSIVTKTFKDLDSTGVTQATPQAMSLVNTGYNITVPALDTSIEDCRCFQVEFSSNVVDQEMEIYSFYYEISGRGISEQ
jgi:hypothetical protein